MSIDSCVTNIIIITECLRYDVLLSCLRTQREQTNNTPNEKLYVHYNLVGFLSALLIYYSPASSSLISLYFDFRHRCCVHVCVNASMDFGRVLVCVVKRYMANFIVSHPNGNVCLVGRTPHILTTTHTFTEANQPTD